MSTSRLDFAAPYVNSPPQPAGDEPPIGDLPDGELRCSLVMQDDDKSDDGEEIADIEENDVDSVDDDDDDPIFDDEPKRVKFTPKQAPSRRKFDDEDDAEDRKHRKGKELRPKHGRDWIDSDD